MLEPCPTKYSKYSSGVLIQAPLDVLLVVKDELHAWASVNLYIASAGLFEPVALRFVVFLVREPVISKPPDIIIKSVIESPINTGSPFTENPPVTANPPVILTYESNVALPLTSNVPLTAKFPLTLVLPLTAKAPPTEIEPVTFVEPVTFKCANDAVLPTLNDDDIIVEPVTINEPVIPTEPVTLSVECNVVAPSTFNEPDVLIFPVASSISNAPPPTLNVTPLYVKFALSTKVSVEST